MDYPQKLSLPSTYKLLQILGEGTFGQVVKCMKQDTKEIVAIKMAKEHHDLEREADMLFLLMENNLDKFNIIKFRDEFYINNKKGLVFEMLDISLLDYILDLDGPVGLDDIRTITKDLATAFDALKRVGVIHGDVKLDNIMMIDHMRHPCRVKLIDFGLALLSSETMLCSIHQPPAYRAPEITLGLPFSEAIDIWSQGCVMAVMIFGFLLFPSRYEYNVLRFIIDLLGPPPNYLLNAGLWAVNFFEKMDSDLWVFKTPEKYFATDVLPTDKRMYTFRSLDEMKMECLEKYNNTEADEWSECIELLKAMLQWEESERITPSGILNHSFITKTFLKSSSHPASCNESEPSTSAEASENMRMTQDDGTSDTLPPDVVVVQSEPPMNRLKDTKMKIISSSLNTYPSSRRNELSLPYSAADTKVPPTTCSDDSDLKERKKKKKKNCFRGFLLWMNKTFCSCCSVDNVQ